MLATYRASGNSLEWLGVPGGLLLYAIATDQTEVTNSLALIALAARLVQSTAHLISTSPGAVNIRSAFFGAQVFICAVWTARFTILA